jgi:hypothetical protein
MGSSDKKFKSYVPKKNVYSAEYYVPKKKNIELNIIMWRDAVGMTWLLE